ncbi:phosphoribosyltransferase [Actinoalloteichus spitiensis]|uniref:phosphoribosyltransferase n=1 Tax=Actinoalloteichus spitiensis TaxID=252394 RepID=UPI00036D07B8|nr:phosphoribosyltransferase [Actinoalloteichus spitiensis]
MPFTDRGDAGRRLAHRLEPLADQDVVVLGLPRGGVPVAHQVATHLHRPLDVVVVRKLGVPGQPELGMGAVGEDGVRVINDHIRRRAGVDATHLAEVEHRERAQVDSRAARFRRGRPRTPVAGRTVVLVDDGIATGSTARAAAQVVRAQGARRVVLAVPVAPPEAVDALRGEVDDLICLETPSVFLAVGQAYAHFEQTSDAEVVDLLSRDHTAPASVPEPRTGRTSDQDVAVTAGAVTLPGHLHLPTHPLGLVIFAHGSGSSRHSPRNQRVADALSAGHIGTLLFDLLTPEEERDRARVFDIPLLADRLRSATTWARQHPPAAGLPLGYFGASTGAAAALWAAADRDADLAAVVSRGGRPDLAGPHLPGVHAPTLLVVGGRDEIVLELNRQAQARLGGPTDLAVVPGATHLFEEPGALDQVADLATHWFTTHLSALTHPA